MRTVKLKLKNNPYNIYIGSGISGSLGGLLKTRLNPGKVLIVSNKKVFGLHGAAIKNSLSKYFNCCVYLMADGERYKNLDTVRKIYDFAAKNSIDRHSCVVALGGGVVGDTAGFVAATYMRGIPVVQVPTSIIAQVDSSIGGKTGVDIKAGKNLVGAFHQPLFVLTDTAMIKTLPKAEYINGLAEVVKHAIITDAVFFNYLKSHKNEVLQRSSKAILHMVGKSVKIKAKIVEKDEKETSGLRAILNYGHTIGHAIEAAAGYKTFKHGEAVASGIAASAHIAETLKICTKTVLIEQIKMLNSFNLLKPLKKLKTSSIIKRMYSDKKAKDGQIRFILTKKIGHVKLVKSVPMRIIKTELKKLYIREVY